MGDDDRREALDNDKNSASNEDNAEMSEGKPTTSRENAVNMASTDEHDPEHDLDVEAAAAPELKLTRSSRLKVLSTPDKGRGVFARGSIPADTLIEVSPVLIVSNEEYNQHTLNKTIFESYLFTWSRAGEYALALGLGSLFNHSDTGPNVSYLLDKVNQCIRYSTKRPIKENEELCIFYGHGVRFGDRGELLVEKAVESEDDEDDVLKALGGFHADSDEDSVSEGSEEEENVEKEGTLIPLSDIPLDFVTGILAPEDIPLETIDAYIVTFVPQSSGSFLKFLTSQNIQQLESIRHLKRIRRIGESTVQGLICPASDYTLEEITELLATSPSFESTGVPELTVVEVPANPARTPSQAKEWSQAYWPVSFIPIKEDVMAKDRAESFTQAKINWMKIMCTKVIQASQEAESKGELPIVCLAAESWDVTFHSLKRKKGIRPVVIAQRHDSRTTSKNPFGHAAMNLIEHVAEMDRNGTRPNLPTNDANYLLTGLTVFMTHEPCLLCSMALLHSRISTLVYVKGSPGAGGCGSEYRLHEQKGTNHRFEVYKVKPDAEWKGMLHQIPDIKVDP